MFFFRVFLGWSSRVVFERAECWCVRLFARFRVKRLVFAGVRFCERLAGLREGGSVVFFYHLRATDWLDPYRPSGSFAAVTRCSVYGYVEASGPMGQGNGCPVCLEMQIKFGSAGFPAGLSM